MRITITFLAAALVLFGCSVIPTFAQNKYTLGIFVRAEDDGSVSGTKVSIAPESVGSTLFDVRGADVINIGSYEAFFTLDEKGSALVSLSPGIYKIIVQNRFYKKGGATVRIPNPDQPSQTTHGVSIMLKKDQKVVSRRLKVTVLGETLDASGRVKTGPVPNARVEVLSEETEWLYSGKTDGAGVVIFDKPFIIGTEVNVSAKAEGWDGQERKLIIGSWQEINPDDRRTTTSDQTVLKLWKKQPDFSLVVEAVNSKTRRPVSGARVVIELIGGKDGSAQVAASSTDVNGRTRSMTFAPLPEFSKHAQYRIKVSASGYEEKWSDIPNELPYLGGAGRNYVVHLEPVARTEEPKQVAPAQAANNGLPPEFRNRQVVRIEKLEPILECWAPGADIPCYEPNLEAFATVYHFADGGHFWDRRDYDNKRKQMAQSGRVFRWACQKSLWRNGRCG